LSDKRFKIDKKIYENIEVIVYKAIDLETGNAVAYKKMIDSTIHKIYGELLRKEYQLINSIDATHVVKPVAFVDDDTLALVTQFAEGAMLKAYVDKGQLSIEDKIEIAIELFKGIDEIHQKHILHKDINPTNIIWENTRKQLTIIDFNIAEKAHSQKIEFVSPEHLQGTLAYISPEQTGRMNRQLDYRSDYYSAGVTLYELFTGKLPFETTDRSELIHHHIAVKPVSPHEQNTEVPLIISKIIMKLLAKDSVNRYQSIAGILYDLEKCQSSDLDASTFILGKGEVMTQLNISQQIYGRDDIISRLLMQFETAAAGSFEHCFLKGYSGIGKTTVIRELYLPISKKSGFFLSGKFDQYNTSVPYSGIIQGIESFINLLLVEEEERLEAWRHRLIVALGQYAGVLTQFVPDLKIIIGEQEVPVEMSGIEAQNRFREALQRFFISISDDAHPIVLFLDDLQWVDHGSLMLLKQIFESDQLRHFLLLGAYRDNEVEPGHRLSTMFEGLRNESVEINDYKLSPLRTEDVQRLFKDSFGVLPKSSYIINQIMEKTKGNAFFIKQLLHHFYDKKCITYHADVRGWKFDETCFQREEVSDNVADFLIDQLKAQEPKFQDLLKSAACIGHSFTLQTISMMMDEDVEEVIPYITILIEENYILSLGYDKYAFSHDQVQQASYGLIDPVEKGSLHLSCATILIDRYRENMTEEVIFEIAGHYREALKVATLVDESDKIFEYLLRAGDISNRNIAYNESIAYYMAAEELADAEMWINNYEVMVALSSKIIKVQYMLGLFEALDEGIERFKLSARHPLDMATAYEQQIYSLMARQEYERGVSVMLDAFNGFGLSLSLEVGPEDYGIALGKLSQLMEGRSIESLSTLPKMTDTRYLNEMEMLTGVVPLLFNVAPQLLLLVILEMVFISIEYGNCKYSSFGYAFLGTILCGAIGDISQGTAYGQLSLTLLEGMETTSELPKVYMVASQHVMHYKEHLNKIIDMEEEGYYKGIDIGDYTYAGFAGHGYCFNSYLAGRELSKVERIFETYTESFNKLNQGTQNLFQHIYLQTIENMRIKEEMPWIMDGKWFNETETLPELIEKGHQTALFVYYFNKMQLCYLFNQLPLALEAANEMAKYLDGGVGLMHVPIYHQYAALIKLATYGEVVEDVHIHLNYLENIGESINYSHRVLSIQAVIARVEKRYDDARLLLEKAIQAVQIHGYIREEAMYRELMCQLYEEYKNEELSLYYHQTAYSCYERWGAIQKLQFCSVDVENSGHMDRSHSIYTLHSVNTAYDTNPNIDMHSILKFSQTMAEEIVYEELLRKLLYILLENAGAQKAIVINYTRDGRVIIAQSHTQSGFEMTSVDHVESYKGLPHKIVRYAYNGKKIVRLDRALSNKLFMDDPYIIDQEVHSALCFPLINKGEIIGIIYLENNLSDGVFSSDRTEFLSLLSSQMSTSLENAMVYQHLESLVERRTTDLAFKNEQLLELNDRLREISVTDGLTKLFNRRKLDDVLANEFEKSKRYGIDLAVILMDIDRFKLINDNYGHIVGDQVLVRFAELLTENTRTTDTVGRWGGEEFLIICPGLNIDRVALMAEKLRVVIEANHFDEIGQRTASFGVTTLKPTDEIKDLIKRADDSLYEAKNSGRNKVISK